MCGTYALAERWWKSKGRSLVTDDCFVQHGTSGTDLGSEISRKRAMPDLVFCMRASPGVDEAIDPGCRAVTLDAQKGVYSSTKDR